MLSLREELVRIFQNPTNLEDDSLFIEVPEAEQRHNNLTPVSSPFFLPSDLPTSPSDSPPAYSFTDPSALSSEPTHLSIPNLQQSSYASIGNSPFSPLSVPIASENQSPQSSNPVNLSPTLESPNQTMTQPETSQNAQAQAPQVQANLPFRGERGAPTVDITKPRQLIRFFKELEPFFVRANIVSEKEKKDLVLKYVDMDLEEIWERYPEYKNQAASYIDFKKAILAHYPEATGEYLYSLADLDSLIGERYRLGIRTVDDLNNFHNQFEALTSWLLEKDHIGKKEQERAYVGAFQPHLWDLIENRLSIKHMDQHPNVPYPISDVYEAARAILQGSYRGAKRHFAQVMSQVATTSPEPTSINPSSPEPTIKMENFGAIISEFTKTMAEILNQTRSRNNYGSSGRSVNCNMCGGEHYIRDCPMVDEYVKAGKCRRNIEGKVVLSTGAYVPREIPGTYLKERIDEWHRRNPGQLAAATLVHTIDKSLLYPPQPTYQLSSSERIAHLESELYALKARKSNFVPLARTRAQRARAAQLDSSDEEDEAPAVPPKKAITPKVVVPPATKERSKGPVMELPEHATPPSVPVPGTTVDTPEHPFRHAKDAAYAPPTSRNIGAPAPQNNKKSEPAYRTQPSIYKASIATDVYSRTMDTPITITQRELLSLSPEVRSQLRDATTAKRVPTQQNDNEAEVANFLKIGQGDDESDSEREAPTMPTFAVPNSRHRIPPEGAFVIPDPIETYVRGLPVGATPDPDKLIVANENHSVRAVFALVDNNRKKECILDSGCQVVTISKAVSHELAIAYDPTFRISMQSANGELDMSLGLARNVPFKIGHVTFYMQAHVIDSNAYEVLLGRPFDVLTESVIRNFANEDQTITIHDPNSGQHVTVPTLARGSQKAAQKAEQDF